MGKIVYQVKRFNKKIKNQKTIQLIGRVHSDEKSNRDEASSPIKKNVSIGLFLWYS
jgi:hypothetical protein